MTLHSGLKFLRKVDILQDNNTASKLGRSLAVYFQTRNRQSLHTPLFQATQEKWHTVRKQISGDTVVRVWGSAGSR